MQGYTEKACVGDGPADRNGEAREMADENKRGHRGLRFNGAKEGCHTGRMMKAGELPLAAMVWSPALHER